MYACFNLAEIRHTYWGSKGKYQYKIWNESNQYSWSYERFHTENKSQTNKVNCFEKKIENRYVARINIKVVPFGG